MVTETEDIPPLIKTIHFMFNIDKFVFDSVTFKPVNMFEPM